MSFAEWVELVGKSVDAAGVAVIVLGIAVAAIGLVGRRGADDLYRSFRQRIGRAILLGLELLVAATSSGPSPSRRRSEAPVCSG